MTVTNCGTVIDAKLITGDLEIDAGNKTTSASTPCVTIKDSLVRGVVSTGVNPGQTGPLVMTDVEVNAPTDSTVQAIGATNFYLERVNVHGGANGGIECYGYCSISDSWIHDFYDAGQTHYDGIISNGNNGFPLVVRHNTVQCNFYAAAKNADGGCSADIGLFGDFAPIRNVTITANLFVAASAAQISGDLGPAYCFYGGDVSSKKYPVSSNVIVTGNTFQRGPGGKCGQFGAMADTTASSGNVWSHNVWDDGTELTL
jgi:hypothetical protein